MTSSGGRLSAIKNLANNPALINNAVLANQPAIGTQLINGLNSIYFDNDDNRWLTTGLNIRTGSQTIFAVVQQVNSGTAGLVYAGDAAEQTIRVSSTNLGFTSNDNASTITLASGTSILTSPAILGIVANSSNSTRSLYKNSDTAGASGGFDGTLGCAYFGANAAASGLARGGFKLGETVIYNRVLPASDITKIVRYLAGRWGVILT
jgi:hypothetical protein